MANRNDQGSGQQGQASYGDSSKTGQSRGERFDEMQGGGRGADSVSGEEDVEQEQGNPAGDAFLHEQPDRQSDAEEQDEEL